MFPSEDFMLTSASNINLSPTQHHVGCHLGFYVN
jgi:hypothetical protein